MHWMRRPNRPRCKGMAQGFRGEDGRVPCSAVMLMGNGYCWRHQDQARAATPPPGQEDD